MPSNNDSLSGGLISLAGSTLDGQPLSFNRAPTPELRPFVSRIYATNMLAESDNRVECGIISDMPAVRFIFGGHWQGRSEHGDVDHGRGVFFYGPQTRRLPATVTGGFSTVSVLFQPGALAAMNGPAVEDYLDRMAPLNAAWDGQDPGLIDRFSPDEPVTTWIERAEGWLLDLVRRVGAPPPDPLTAAFDRASLVDPNIRITDFSELHGISPRTLSRRITRDFGLSPKRVLRRARALDLAASLRGLAPDGERDLPSMKYYDQSHMIREFSEICDTTPGVFATTPQPILTMTLETRQMRRLEALGILQPGQTPPWRRA